MRRRDKEEGYTLVIIAAVLVVFLGFTALSVDVGVLYSARASAQRAADAAALAGAFVFITRPDLTESTTPKQSVVIRQHAISTAATNKMLGAAVTIADSDVVLDTTNLDANNQMISRLVTVNVNQNQPTLFAQILGETLANIHATAIAEAAKNATGDRCTKPWFIPNTVLSSADSICDTTQGAVTEQGACSKGELLIDPATGELTAFAQNWIATSCPPRQFVVKPQNPLAEGVLSPGTFLAIQLGDPGAAVYESNIATCAPVVVSCTKKYCTEQGAMVGPTTQGVCQLICYNGDQNCNNCQKDKYIAPGRYERPDKTEGSTSRSLVVAPIIDVCKLPCPTPNGTAALCDLPMIGYAMIFIEDFGNGGHCGGGGGGTGQPGVVGRLINIIPCSAGFGSGGTGGGINPEETGSFSLPIRLVRVP